MPQLLLLVAAIGVFIYARSQQAQLNQPMPPAATA